MHELDPNRPAVRVPQGVDDLTKRLLTGAGQTVGDEVSVEVPHREPVVREVEFRVGEDLPADRVEFGQEMSSHPVHVDELDHPGLLFEICIRVVGRRPVATPHHRFVGNPQRGEDLLVETTCAEQQIMEVSQELTGLGPLNDSMVVRARNRDELADAELGQHLGVRGLVLGGISDRTGPDDQALALHKARHGLRCAYRSGVREGHRRVGEILEFEIVVTNSSNQVLVGIEEALEVELIRVLDIRNQQDAVPGPLDVDRQTKVDALVMHRVRGPVDLGVARSHCRSR